MTSPIDLLLFGHDVGLQHTRSLILKKDGFRVNCVTTLTELKTCLAAKPYRLVVLCHSLSVTEKRASISLAAAFLPEVKSLALEKDPPGIQDYPLAQVLHTRRGPEAFRSAVFALANSTKSPPA